MKRIATGVLAGLCVTTMLSAAAQDETDDARSEQAVERGRSVLDDVGRAYREAGAMHDTVTMNINSPMGEQSDQFKLRLGSETDAEITVQGYRIVTLGDKFYVELDGLEDKYLEADLEENLLETMRSVFGAADLPVPHLGLRYATDTEQRIGAFGMGVVEDVKLVGHRTDEHDGNQAQVLLFEGEGGTMSVFVINDLIRQVEFDLTPAGMPDDFAMDGTLSMDPQIVSELDEPIEFSTDGREAVSQMQDLQPTPVETGEAAPDFELTDLDGETVKLSDLRGEVVVLDFWATWCGPCIAAMPKVDEFAKWARDNDMPVRVFAVNVWENVPAEERHDHVAEFWNEKGYSFPTLLDLDDSVVMEYGVSGIPTSFVIGPDGTVRDVTVGAATLEGLKERAREAMERTG